MKIIVMPGDGIGPEIVAATRRVLDVVNERCVLGLEFESHDVGFKSLEAEGTTFPARVLERCREAEGIVLGPVSHSDYPPSAQGGVNPSGRLRIELDLYANVRPSRTREGMRHWGRGPMDLVIVRENTEGFYADRNMALGNAEMLVTEDVAISLRRITRTASARIARVAFELASARKKHVFLREVRRVAVEFPAVTYDEQLVDSMAALLVRDAARFDVVVTTNMYGDILSDEAAEISGGLGLAGSINAGDTHCMAQAQHGSAPDIAGKDEANPSSLILSAAMLLEWLAIRHANGAFARAQRLIESALDTLLMDPRRHTADLGGRLGTKAFTDELCGEIAIR